MSKARLVITAVVAEGRSQGEVARQYGVSQGWVSKLVARYRAEGEAASGPPVPAAEDLAERDRGRGRRPDRAAAEGPGGAGPGRRAAHHCLAPGTPPPDPGLGGHDQPVPDGPRPGHCRRVEAAEELLHPIPRGDAEPVLAIRFHPLPARRWHRHRDLDLAR